MLQNPGFRSRPSSKHRFDLTTVCIWSGVMIILYYCSLDFTVTLNISAGFTDRTHTRILLVNEYRSLGLHFPLLI